MAVSKINNSDWYTEGEKIKLEGVYVSLSGQSQPINAGFSIPGKKRIPSGATFTFENFHCNWLRAESGMYTPVLHEAYILGDSIVIALKASEGLPALTFCAAHFDSGYVVIHL